MSVARTARLRRKRMANLIQTTEAATANTATHAATVNKENATMNADLQKLQDMLGAMQSQRDQALNAHVVLQAENAALRRTVADRDSRIKALEAEIEKLTPTEVAA